MAPTRMRPTRTLFGLALIGATVACDGRRSGQHDSAAVTTDAGDPSRSRCADSTDAFRRIVTEFQSRQRNAALVVGVRHQGVTVYREANGFANLEEQQAADPDMAFGLASVSKAVTGVALLRTAEAGQIDLDAEIQRYVPELPRHPSGTPITVRMLVHHLGAIRHWGAERTEALYGTRFKHVDALLALIRDDPWVPDLVPGTRYAYSSHGYNILAVAMQRATGTSFQEAVASTVLRPLRLTSVQFDAPGLGGVRRPARYSWYDLTDFRELDDAPQRVPDRDYSHNMAGGGLIANVDDLLTFGRAMRTPGLLRAESLALIWRRPRVLGVESPMSFGWYPRVDPERIAITGSNAGVQAGLVVWRDEDLVVTALANSWGRGSRSGEFMDDGPDGLIGRLAAVCLTTGPTGAH